MKNNESLSNETASNNAEIIIFKVEIRPIVLKGLSTLTTLRDAKLKLD